MASVFRNTQNLRDNLDDLLLHLVIFLHRGHHRWCRHGDGRHPLGCRLHDLLDLLLGHTLDLLAFCRRHHAATGRLWRHVDDVVVIVVVFSVVELLVEPLATFLLLTFAFLLFQLAFQIGFGDFAGNLLLQTVRSAENITSGGEVLKVEAISSNKTTIRSKEKGSYSLPFNLHGKTDSCLVLVFEDIVKVGDQI